MTIKQAKDLIEDKLSRYFSSSLKASNPEQLYRATALVIRDALLKKKQWSDATAGKQKLKRVYYLCMEFLLGRSLRNHLYNLDCFDIFRDLFAQHGFAIEDVIGIENDPGLGNGGLGRLAACYLDSLATLQYPAMGFSLRYEYGLFRQKIVDNTQVELPDLWLDTGDIWMMARPEKNFKVRLGGTVREYWENGRLKVALEDANVIEAIPYDLLISGAGSKSAAVLRLWRAAAAREFDMNSFTQGDYTSAMRADNEAELITKVLYPADDHSQGKQLRLYQQYFLVSASLQNIFADHLKHYESLNNIHEKVAIHINDTHPALAVPEMMRLLMDEHGYDWDFAWELTQSTIAYTNHTVLSEALEKWDIDLVRLQLPRIYQIIDEINRRFEEQVGRSPEVLAETAILWHRQVRMANLSVIGSHSVNGVSALHSGIIKDSIFKGFSRLWPQKFKNVTNGIAHRRWLNQSNPRLAALLEELIGHGYYKHAERLAALTNHAGDHTVLTRLGEIKAANKKDFADDYYRETGRFINPDSRFDVQIKRLHEYKRQLLNVLKILKLYLDICDDPQSAVTPQTFIFGAKAAGSYFHAKRIISLICCLSEEIGNRPEIRSKLDVVFLENYNVTKAEKLIPASEVSEQISLAGKEASGTSNMKFMLNGALTLGTVDGANVEILENVGKENMFTFGLKAHEVEAEWTKGNSASNVYSHNRDIRRVIDKLRAGIGGKNFSDIAAYLTIGSGNIADPYMCLLDFEDYMRAYHEMDQAYADPIRWNGMSLQNIARAGVFAADRSITEYAKMIWNLKPVR